MRLLGRLPLPVLYVLGRLVSLFALHVMRWRRDLAMRNLARAFPGKPPAERERILRQTYRSLGELLAESVWGWRASADALRQRVQIADRGLLDRVLAQKRSVVVLSAHLGNWEWLLLAAGAELGVPIDPIYKPLRPESLEAYVREARGRFGGRPIVMEEALYELMRRSGEARAYAMPADQTPPREAAKHWLRFLNQDTAFYAGIGKIARFLDAPVLYVTMHRESRGRYTAHPHLVCEPPYDTDPDPTIVSRYAEQLERDITAHPADWLWIHRKWKYPKSADEPYGAVSG
jgi:KDO2-lipid IV(A) lauroyltransferase